jgi:metal-responsive CopG/Arc/MetJ family transcriptional regulator
MPTKTTPKSAPAQARASDLTRTSVQLPKALLRAAQHVALERDETISDVLRKALEDYAASGRSRRKGAE